MREIILLLIKEKPKHYGAIIKRNKEMFDWIKNNSLIDSASIVEMVYSAVYKVSNICPNGNKMQVKRFSSGFQGCGPANKCKCTKDKIAKKVSKTKLAYTTAQNEEINTKRKLTMVNMYGVEYNLQRADVKRKLKKPKIDIKIHALLNNKEWMNEEYNNKQRNLTDIADQLGVYYGTVGYYCIQHGFNIRKRTNYSQVEVSIEEYINTLGFATEAGNWTILSKKEIDIYVPSIKFGIEVDGLYWHSYNPSTGPKENQFGHQEKTLEAKKKGVDLIHITDHDWVHKTDIIKSMLASKMGLNAKIYARKCIIKQVLKKNERSFLDDYHIQGYSVSSLCYGLYYANELVMLASIGKSRFSKEITYELIRMCSAPGITVVGGGSKLVKYLANKVKSDLLTYCDIDFSNGNGYLSMGFEYIKITPPGYFWTDGANKFSRYTCQKKNLGKWLVNFNIDKSASINLFEAGYRRFHNSGNYVFVWRYSSI